MTKDLPAALAADPATPDNPAPQLKSHPLREWLESKTTAALAVDLRDNPMLRVDLRQYQELARVAVCPGERREVAAVLARLSVHYPQPDLLPAMADARWADWLHDLRDMPLDVVEGACTHWRRSPAPFMPTPGQLLEIARPMLRHRRTLLSRATTALEVAEGSGAPATGATTPTRRVPAGLSR